MGMAKYDRLLYILNLLRSRRNLNAARLAEECQVTERSIYRDIIALSEANIPIYYDNGYKLASDNFLPPLNFDFEEYTGLQLALKSSPLARTPKYREVLKRITAKVEAGLSSIVKDRKRITIDTTHLNIPMSTPDPDSLAWVADLEESIASDRVVEMEYESLTSGVTTRAINPYFIVFRARAFYVVAFCHLRGDFRTFRLDRIRSLSVSDMRFRRENSLDPRTYFEGSWELYAGDEVEVILRLTGLAARVVELGCHHKGETIHQISENEVEYRVSVRGTEEIKRWILGFGDEAEVLAPESLRRELSELSAILYDRYCRQGPSDCQK